MVLIANSLEGLQDLVNRITNISPERFRGNGRGSSRKRRRNEHKMEKQVLVLSFSILYTRLFVVGVGICWDFSLYALDALVF